MTMHAITETDNVTLAKTTYVIHFYDRLEKDYMLKINFSRTKIGTFQNLGITLEPTYISIPKNPNSH